MSPSAVFAEYGESYHEEYEETDYGFIPPEQQTGNEMTMPWVDLTDMPPTDNLGAGTPFAPDEVNNIHGITYIRHEAGLCEFTDETIAVLEIAPNANARLVAGVPHYTHLQGYRAVSQMARAYTEQGYDVIAAINGGFFGLTNQRGVQVLSQGVFIHDGELLRHWGPHGTNEYISQEHYIIGALKDGEFFHGHNPLHTMYINVSGGYTRTLKALNSPRSVGNPHWQDLNLLTERFGETVPSPSNRLEGRDVRLEVISGRMAFGEELLMRVVQTAHPAEYNALIGAGHAILTAANPGDMAFLDSLRADDIIRVSHTLENRRGTTVDWAQVEQAVPAHFTLIRSGVPQPLPWQPGALVPGYPEITPNPETNNPLPHLPSQNTKRPRTAVGLRADGTMVWVVVSGSFNSGMTMGEFQSYLLSLGLKYAWNFDGGGSSAMVIGETLVTYSAGVGSAFQRPVANGLVLVSPPLPDNTVEISVQPRNVNIIQGESGSLYVRARSTAGELSFQWYRYAGYQNSEPVGENAPVLDISNLEAGEHYFRVMVSAGTAAPQVSNIAIVTVSEPPIPFIDVQGDDWFTDYVMYVYENGLMSGTGTEPMRFSPNMTLTRGMLVTVLYRHAGMPDISGIANPFDDADAGQWYTDAVIWAADRDIVQGIGGGRFAPEQNITREQIAVIMLRYANAADKILSDVYQEQVPVFADDEIISDWADEAVRAIRQAGIIFGRPDNMFDPQGNATRAEASAILRRFTQGVREI